MALETALRAGEQFGLRRQDVNLEAGILIVVSYKGRGRRVRHVPISDRARAVLVELLARAGPESNARLYEMRSVSQSFASACEAAGIKGVRWHDLRHTAITWMLAAINDPGEVMKISGHDNWTTFLKYVTINSDIARELSRKMNERRALVEERADEMEKDA